MALFTGIAWSALSANFVANEGGKLLKQVPEMTFKDGDLVKIDKPVPYTVKNPWVPEGDPLIVFDPRLEAIEPDELKSQFLFGKSRIYSKPDKDDPMPFAGSSGLAYSLGITDGVLTGDLISESLTWFMIGFSVISVVLGIPLVWALLAVQSVFYALTAILIGNLIGNKLSFREAYRLAIMCITPVTVVSTVLAAFVVNVPFWEFITIPIVLVYIAFAVFFTNTDGMPDLPKAV